MAVAAEYVAALGADLSGLEAGIKKAKDTLAKLGEGVPAKGIDSFVDKARASLGNFGAAATKMGTAMSIGLTVPLTLLGKQALDAGRSFETAFAGVRKTVEATEPEFAALRQSFRDMAKEIPITANELAKIGEAAGALGVKKEDILSFTRTMADLGVTTNLTSDQAANGLARIANIMKNEAGPQYDRLGATLVALGNAGASTEAEILEMSLRIAGAGKVAGLSEADILSFANALSSVGIEAEAGGSSISKVFLGMSDAVKLGGKELQIFAQTAGMSAAQFKKAFQDDAASAAISFIEGLGKISAEGKSLTPILKELELNEIRVRDALLRASGAGDLFRESLQLGSKAWEENSALTKEAAERYKTFDSQVQILKNQLTDVGITIFEQVRPALVSMVASLKDAGEWVGKLDPQFVKMGIAAATVFAVSGPLLVGIGKVSTALAALGAGAAGGPIGLAIAGVLALATAYSVNFGHMQETIDGFFGDFTDKSSQLGRDMQSLATVATGIAIAITQIADTFISIVRMAAQTISGLVGMVRSSIDFMFGGGEAAAAKFHQSVTGTFEGLSGVYDEHNKRFIQRSVETRILSEKGWQGYFDHLSQMSALAAETMTTEFRNKFDLTTPVFSELRKMKGPVKQEAQQTGVDLGKAIMFGWDSQTRRSPFFIIHDLQDALLFAAAMPDKLATHLGNAGKKAKKEFELGFAGFETFVDKIADKLINSPNSLDKVLAPSFKKMKQGAQEAFDEILASVNKYLSAQGKANQVTGEQLFNLAKNHKEAAKNVIENARAYEQLGGAIDTVNFQRVAKELAPVDNEFKLLGRAIEFSITTFEQLKKQTPEVIAGLTKLGFSFKTTFPQAKEAVIDFAEAMKTAEISMRDFTDKAATYTEQWSKKTDADLERVQERLKKFGTDAPSWSGGVVEAASRIKNALDESVSLSIVKAQLAVQGSIDSMIGDFERMADHLNLSGDQWEAYVEQNIRKELAKAKDLNAEAVDAIVEKWKKGLVTLPGIWDDIFKKASANTRKGVSDVLAIVDLIPGRVGDALRKAGSEFERWYQIIDKTIRLIERALGEKETEGLGGILKGIVDSFKNNGAKVEAVLDDIFGPVQGQKSGKGFADSFMGQIKDIFSGKGGISGVIGNILGVGSIITGAIGLGKALWGGIKSLFGFGGKSEAEKAAEEGTKLQLQAAQQGVLKAIEDTKQSLIKTADDARKLLEGLLDFTKVPKANIKAFFKNLQQVMDEFVKLAGQWKEESLKKAKKLADAMGPVVDTIGAAVGSLSLMSGYPGVAKATIEQFFNDLEIAVTLFGELAESLPNKLEKRAKKLGERLRSVVEVIGGGVLAFMGADGQPGLKYYAGVPAEAFKMFEADLLLAVEMMGRIADKVDNSMVKAAQRFSEKVISVALLIQEGMNAFLGGDDNRGLVDYAKIPVEVFDVFFADLLIAANKMAEIVTQIDTSILAKAELFSQKSIAVFKAISEGVKAFKALHDYKAIPAEVMEAFVTDFDRAISLITQLMLRVEDFEAIAIAFESRIISAADHLTNGIKIFTSSIVDGISQLNGAFGHINTAVFNNPLSESSALQASSFSSVGSQSLAASSFGGQSFTNISTPSSFVSSPNFASSSQPSQTIVHVHVNVQGSLIHESRVVDTIHRALEQLKTTNKLQGILRFAPLQ